MHALYLLHILYNVHVYKGVRQYCLCDSYTSVPQWTYNGSTSSMHKITGDNSLYKILIPNIIYKFNYLTCHVIQTKYTEYPTELDRVSIHVKIKYDNIQVRISYCFTLKHMKFR